MPPESLSFQRCVRCQRANPLDAAFCHFDGLPLHTVQIAPTSRISQPPVLDITPRRLHIPQLRHGEACIILLTITNRGSGELSGDIANIEQTNWIRIEPSRFRTRMEQSLEVTIDAGALPGMGHFFTRLRVTSNAGAVEVPVQVDVVAQGGTFQGHAVADANAFAKLMLAHPRQAIGWLQGDAQRFFREQGWTFPITGPIAPSLAGIQQFFEVMKLTKVPDVYAETALEEVICQKPDRLRRSLRLYTDSKKKWVYAFVESSVIWLIPEAASFSGARECQVNYEIDSSLLESGRSHEGHLRITVNGQRQVTITIRVDVHNPDEPWTRKLLRPFVG